MDKKELAQPKTFNGILELIENFPNEDTCRKHLESMRWPDGKPVCPYCKHDYSYRFSDGRYFKCAKCRKRYTVTVGTIFHGSHVPLRKWFMAIYLMTSHKKGIASLQLSKDLKVKQETAWFMLHRIRHMFKFNSTEQPLLTGAVEVDETYVGGKPKKGDKRRDVDGNKLNRAGRGTLKVPVVGLVERSGRVIATPVQNVGAETLHGLIGKHVEEGAIVITDGLQSYSGLKEYEHFVVNHSEGEYVSEEGWHTNTIEGFWGLLKRGIIGIYHTVSSKHLDSYCNEFTFRYSTRLSHDTARFNRALGMSGKRLQYQELITKPDLFKRSIRAEDLEWRKKVNEERAARASRREERKAAHLERQRKRV